MTFSAVRYVIVDAKQAGRRLDNFLCTHLKGVPLSRIYRIIRKGEVRVNGKRAQVGTRLMVDETVRIPPIITADETSASLQVPKRVLDSIRGAIVYEDADVLVVNKPAGMPVHAGTGVAFGVIETLRAAHPMGEVLALSHRLDRHTSGCLIIAKGAVALRKLHTQFRERVVVKSYLTLVAGQVSFKQEHEENSALYVTRGKGGERCNTVDPVKGKPSKTRFYVEKRFKQATLLRADLMTGRLHQIRVHCQHLGHPVAGDTRYGDVGFNQTMRDLGLHHMFLHAEKVVCISPSTGKRIECQSPLPDDCMQVLNTLPQAW